MKLSNFVLGLTLALMSAGANAATARQPFLCELAQNGAIVGYEMEKVSGFIYPSENQIALEWVKTNRDGVDVGSGEVKVAYVVQNGQILVTIPTESGNNLNFKVSAEMLSQPGSNVDGSLDMSPLLCRLQATYLPSQTRPQGEFEKFDLPATTGDRLREKSWTSSDGRFSFHAEWIADFERKGHLNLGWSSIDFTFFGDVIDGAKDEPRYINYLLYGSEKRVVQMTMSNPSDVQKIISIFNATKSKFALVHPYGLNSPVTLEIDCSSKSACVITARN